MSCARLLSLAAACLCVSTVPWAVAAAPAVAPKVTVEPKAAGSPPVADTKAAVEPKVSGMVERVAVVDVQRVLTETVEGKRELEKIKQAFSKADARLNQKAEGLEAAIKDLQSKSAMLNEAELRKREESIVRQQQELQQLAAESQQDMMEQESIATQAIYTKVAALVKQLALEEDLQVVLVKSEMTVLYANPKLDLTNRIIVRYDKKHS